MQIPLTRRAFARVGAGSLAIGATSFSGQAQTPGATPEVDAYQTLLDRLDALDPQSTFEILSASALAPDSVIALTTDARLVLLGKTLDADEPCVEGNIGFVRLLHDLEGAPFLGGYLVYADEAAAVAASDCIANGAAAALGGTFNRFRLAGLESTMLVGGNKATGVLTRVKYVIVACDNQDLDEPATSFEAQLTMLQLNLELIKHLDLVVPPVDQP